MAGTTPEDLGISRFTSDLDRSVHRWSFSAITTGRRRRFRPIRTIRRERTAEPMTKTSPTGQPPDALPDHLTGAVARAGPWSGCGQAQSSAPSSMPSWRRVDFAAPTSTGRSRQAIGAELDRSGFDPAMLAPEGVDGRHLLATGLRAAIETPLGPLFGTTRPGRPRTS